MQHDEEEKLMKMSCVIRYKSQIRELRSSYFGDIFKFFLSYTYTLYNSIQGILVFLV